MWLFVYGSLMNHHSRLQTLQDDVEAREATLPAAAGLERRWCYRDTPRQQTCLGLVHSATPHAVDGMLLRVQDFAALDAREAQYMREPVHLGDGNWAETYIVSDPQPPTPDFPIRDEYVQLCSVRELGP
jgi:hypothetical protein